LTVIAWDGKHLAVDRRATGNGAIHTSKKFRELEDGTVLVASGSKDMSLAMMDWYAQGAHAQNFPDAQKADVTAVHLIVFKDGWPVEYGRTPFPMRFEDRIQAWGSGSDLAIGAMEAGADAEEAVAIASRRESSCGNGVDVFPRPPAPKQWDPSDLEGMVAAGRSPQKINMLKKSTRQWGR